MKVKELSALTWQEVKAIADEAGYEKPKDSAWMSDEVLAEVEKATESKSEIKSEVEAESKSEIKSEIKAESKSEVEAESKTKYATDYFERNNIPYCKACGAQFQHKITGEAVCAESRSDCPRLKE